MNCQEVQDLLYAYIDAELDAANSLEVEKHLRECKVCRQHYERHQALRAALQGRSLYFHAPLSLHRRVRSALPRAARRPVRPAFWLSAAVLAALLLLLGGLGFWGFTQLRSNSVEEKHMAQAAIDSHERSLVANHLVDNSSANPKELQRWFESKLGFAPPVIDLTIQGYSLIGGRVDFLSNRAVATVVYKCGNHVITLFIWPGSQNTDMHTLSMQGYYVTHWARYGMDCWAVADLDKSQMQQFARLINQYSETFL